MNSLRKPWICVCVAHFLFSGHLLQLAESFTWKPFPPNSNKAITGSTASLTWSYELERNEKFTYSEFRRVTGGNSTDIGDINADGVITAIVPKKMSLTATNNSAVLSIHGIKRSDQTKYCCKMVTSMEREENCIHLKVLVPPKLDVSPSDKKVNETESLALFCNATGIPAPNISWTKVGSDKQFSQKENLVISRVRQEDSGIYVCIASSEAGNVTGKAFVKVQSPMTSKGSLGRKISNWLITAGPILGGIVFLLIVGDF